MEASWDKELVSEEDVLDIVETFKLANLDDVYTRLGLAEKDVEDAKLSDTHSPKKRAKNILNLWRNRTGEEATRGAFIKAVEKCPDCRASLNQLKRQWKTTTPENPERDSKLHECQKHLQYHYKNILCKIPLFPGDYDNLIKLKDIYTRLSISINLPKPCKPVKIPLASYDEMFTRTTEEGDLYTRLLISAPAGLGKSTITAKIAYDWATKAEESPLKDVPLLFVLNMRWLDHTSNLEDAILSHIFPEEPNITAEQLHGIIRNLGENVIIILDAVDESDRMLYNHPENSGSIVKLLTGKILVSCRLIVLTRPWRITEINKRCNAFTHFEIQGFKKEDIKTYIKRFFSESESLIDSLIEHMTQNKLIASVASVPLMAQLICVYWNEIQGPLESPSKKRKWQKFPHRISLLYDAIINIMNRHHLRKQDPTESLQEDSDDVQRLTCQLGKMALRGMWPPENRVVFTPDGESEKDVVDKACQIGLLSREKPRLSIILTIPNQTSVTFFHKTCGEKCAGVYLGNLADKNPKELAFQLQSIKTVEDALSIQLILRFASGASVKAAEEILKKLMEIFQREVQPSISEYYADDLELDDTLKIQRFIDVCLSCNYEADNKEAFNNLLSHLFPEGRVNLLGVSASTAVELGYFMSHSAAGHIRSVTLKPVPHAGDIIEPDGPLDNFHIKSSKEAKQISLCKVQAICRDFLNKSAQSVHADYTIIASQNPTILLGIIHTWQACESLPSAEESNIHPIIDSLRSTNLQVLAISGYKLGHLADTLIDMIEDGHLAHMLELRVSNIGIDVQQMERLAASISKMPLLRLIDTSMNKAGESLQIMAQSLSSMESLQTLNIEWMSATAQAMSVFIQEFPKFVSKLWHLRMVGNAMNDTVAKHMISHIPLASALRDLRIDVGGLSKQYHNQLVTVMQHLSQLQRIQILNSQYTGDLMRSAADVMGSLEHLSELALSATYDEQITSDSSVNSSTFQHFKTKLHVVRRMEWLDLRNITLETDEFQDLVSLCRKKGFKRLGYDIACLPEGIEVPQDDFFMLY